MNSEPKVSCICITHNRVEMFKRVKKYFEQQTYENKELVVLFENDPATEDYIKYNTDCNYYELQQQIDLSYDYFILSEVKDRFYLENGLKVSLKNKAEEVLRIGENSKCVFAKYDSEEYNLIIDNYQEGRFLLKNIDSWLFMNNNTLELTNDKSKAHLFGHTIHLDTSVGLDVELSEFQDRSLEKIGWKKKLIREVENSTINFYKIVPTKKMSLGMKRNLSIAVSNGEYICVWDDDDWYADNRIEYQMNYISFAKKNACALAYTILIDHNTNMAYYNTPRATGHENTLLFEKKEAGQYGNLNFEEDSPMLFSFYNRNQLSVIDNPDLYIYNYHKKNTCSSTHFNKIIGWSTLLDKDYSEKVLSVQMVDFGTI